MVKCADLVQLLVSFFKVKMLKIMLMLNKVSTHGLIHIHLNCDVILVILHLYITTIYFKLTNQEGNINLSDFIFK